MKLLIARRKEVEEKMMMRLMETETETAMAGDGLDSSHLPN
jgi:hypothetical protein